MSLTTLLKIKYPIIQGAMAQIATSELVVAVSNAGGLGIIASGGMSASQLQSEIDLCRAQTEKPFGVNLMLLSENIQELVEVVVANHIAVVTTGAGTPKPYLAQLKAAGVLVIPVVPTVSIAKKMADLGVDAIIAEGTEAGGHVGEITTMALLPQVAAAVDIPVIAAGGIGNGQGMVAAFALGAVGVQCGSLFLSASECPVADNFKTAVLAAKETDTIVTGRSLGAPVRSLKNELTLTYQQLEREEVSRHELEKLTLGSLSKAVKEGDVEQGTVMVGQIVGLVNEVRPAKEIIETLMSEQAETLARLNL